MLRCTSFRGSASTVREVGSPKTAGNASRFCAYCFQLALPTVSSHLQGSERRRIVSDSVLLRLTGGCRTTFSSILGRTASQCQWGANATPILTSKLDNLEDRLCPPSCGRSSVRRKFLLQAQVGLNLLDACQIPSSRRFPMRNLRSHRSSGSLDLSVPSPPRSGTG